MNVRPGFLLRRLVGTRSVRLHALPMPLVLNCWNVRFGSLADTLTSPRRSALPSMTEVERRIQVCFWLSVYGYTRDQNSSVGRLMGRSPSKAEYYRGRAEDCCRNAIIAEDVERRLHWLEAAARWVSLARQEGALLPIKVDGSPLSIREVRDAPGSVPMPKRKPRPCTG